MTDSRCPKALLVEAMRDGRLGPQDRASIERHLGSCAECRDLARDLELIAKAVREPLDPATPLEHQRARTALLGRASQIPSYRPPPLAPESRARPSRSANLSRFALAAAILALALGVGWFGGRVSSSSEHPAVAFGIGLGSELLGDANPATKPTARETSIRPSDDAKFERSSKDGVEVVALANGALDLTVRQLAANERFVVRTSDAEIEVHASAFRVEAEQGRVRGVKVDEGTLEVRYAGFTAVIPSGGSWRATSDAPIVSAPSASAAPIAVAVNAPRVALREPATKPATTPAHEHDARPEPVPTTAPASEPPIASREFARAMEAIEHGDYATGATRLEAFSSAHPHDARGDEADYLQAIALQRAGRADDARAAAKRYLRARPDGAHRAEARRIAGE